MILLGTKSNNLGSFEQKVQFKMLMYFTCPLTVFDSQVATYLLFLSYTHSPIAQLIDIYNISTLIVKISANNLNDDVNFKHIIEHTLSCSRIWVI